MNKSKKELKKELRKEYKSLVTQLIIESRTFSNFSSNSRLGKLARKSIISIGKSITRIEDTWIEFFGYTERILNI